MKKQIYGIALFVAIVGVSVFTYEYFSNLRGTDCASAELAKCAPEPGPYVFSGDTVDYRAKDIAVRVEYAEAGIKARAVKTRLKLEWLGEGEPPASVWVQLRFHNFDGSTAGWASEPVRINKPFENYDVRISERVFDCARCNSLPRNLYATASVWSRENAGRTLVDEIKDMKSVVVQE
jgi:hypothetical protein